MIDTDWPIGLDADLYKTTHLPKLSVLTVSVGVLCFKRPVTGWRDLASPNYCLVEAELGHTGKVL